MRHLLPVLLLLGCTTVVTEGTSEGPLPTGTSSTGTPTPTTSTTGPDASSSSGDTSTSTSTTSTTGAGAEVSTSGSTGGAPSMDLGLWGDIPTMCPRPCDYHDPNACPGFEICHPWFHQCMRACDETCLFPCTKTENLCPPCEIDERTPAK